MRKITSAKDLLRRVKKRVIRLWGESVYKRKEEGEPHSADRITHVTYYKIGNLGDTVLSQCVRKTLEQLCGITNYNILPVNAPITEKVIEQINESRLLVIGGGGLFLPDTNANSVSGWQWAISQEDMRKIKIPIVLYSVGYNYFRGQSYNKLFEENLGYIISQSAFVGLRNSGSIREVKRILIERQMGNRLEERCDISYQPCTTTLIRYIYPNLPSKKESGKIAVNIAFDRASLRFGVNQDAILSQIAGAMKELERKGYSIYCVAHCERDFEFLPYLNQAGVRCKKVDMSDWFPYKAIKFYNGIDCVIGMRGHAQMIPFGVNCEIISLGSHEKMRWFLEDINALDWYIELRDNIPELKDRIVETFVRIHEQEPEWTRERLLSAQQKLWDITVDNARIISGLMKKN